MEAIEYENRIQQALFDINISIKLPLAVATRQNSVAEKTLADRRSGVPLRVRKLGANVKLIL